MARFNATIKSSGGDTVNLAGGRAFQESAPLELASLILTSFVEAQFYREAQREPGKKRDEEPPVAVERVRELLAALPDRSYGAKVAVFARNEFGMRSITHVVAGELARAASGKSWSKRFYDRIIHRPDDMLEIIAYYASLNGGKVHPLPNAMKKGFAAALNRFDTYQLAKYRGDDRAVKLVDLLNLIHAHPGPRNEAALKALVAGELKNTDTWEAKLSQAGQAAESEEDKAALKAEAWRELLREKKLGYLATLRNLRNIIEQAPDMIDEACAVLTNEAMLRKSLVLPFRFYTAFKILLAINSQEARKAIIALSQALDMACANVPALPGQTLVLFDESGSMRQDYGNQKVPAITGSLFSAVLAKAENADLMTFSSDARYRTYNPLDSVLTIMNGLLSDYTQSSTDFRRPFEVMNRAYDRIIFLSDMQGWVGFNTPLNALAAYKRKYHCDPHIYSFDLAGYGTLQFPERRVYALAGFSEKVFDIMAMLEEDPQALVHRIEAVEL